MYYGQSRIWNQDCYFWFEYMGTEGMTEDGPFDTIEQCEAQLHKELEDLFVECEGDLG